MTESIADLIYESKGTPKSLWNTYRIFNDRIELQFRFFFTKIIIPKDTFVKVDVYKPPVIRTVFWALKIDLADLYTHVGIERNSGIFKKLRFTPSNPNEFKQKIVSVHGGRGSGISSDFTTGFSIPEAPRTTVVFT